MIPLIPLSESVVESLVGWGVVLHPGVHWFIAVFGAGVSAFFGTLIMALWVPGYRGYRQDPESYQHIKDSVVCFVASGLFLVGGVYTFALLAAIVVWFLVRNVFRGLYVAVTGQ